MPSSHFIRGVAAASAIALAGAASAQQPPPPPPAPGQGASSFTIFVRGVPLGTEQMAVTRTADGWMISSSGRLGAPIDIVARRMQVRYTPDWRPVEFSLDATVKGQAQSVRTIVENGTAKTEIHFGTQQSEKSDPVDPASALILTNNFFASYEAVAVRLKEAAPGTEISAYAIPQGSFKIRVGESSSERIETATGIVQARRTHVSFLFPGTPLEGEIWTDDTSRMVRFSLPTQSLEVAREDIASVAARRVPISRPNDEQVRIQANGFTLAGTLSRPANASEQPLPAVVLVSGSGPNERDSIVAGIPILGQLASAIADGGFMVLRYDKRGVGQSGGRAESAGLPDYAEDVRAAVKYLSDRKDVDGRRIAVLGHSEGGSVALLAAAKDKKIAALVLAATPGVVGADLVLAQQAHALDRMKMSDADRQARVETQKKIQEAVITGKGLDQLPAAIRRQVDNPEFQTLLTMDPAKVMPDVKQPILVVQGALDTQVEPSNADRLSELARHRKNAPPVEVQKVDGVNHLLVPAKTGEVDEYGSLPDKRVSPAVSSGIVAWLKKTLAAPAK
ncbi:MAG TPA: alpha/beta fold hydrolase [Vicinamibacterales bacterium]|jgi:pimeloyl-ACP methyl ester carboxylesterase|nr:alpha/beta fold hydrolase [Vicinamibacterales bacterium]